MEEQEIFNRIYSYAFYSIALGSFVLSLFSYSIVLVFISIIMLIFSAITYHSGHILNNILIKRSNIIEIYNGFTVCNDGFSLYKKVGNKYLGISIATFKPKDDGRISDEVYRSLISNVHEPFCLSVCINEINKKRLTEPLEVKRQMKEIEYRRTSSKVSDKRNEIKRELELIDEELENLNSSKKSLEIVISLKTFVYSSNWRNSARESLYNLKNISSILSTEARLDCEILRGEELLSFVEVS